MKRYRAQVQGMFITSLDTCWSCVVKISHSCRLEMKIIYPLFGYIIVTYCLEVTLDNINTYKFCLSTFICHYFSKGMNQKAQQKSDGSAQVLFGAHDISQISWPVLLLLLTIFAAPPKVLRGSSVVWSFCSSPPLSL